MFEFFKNVEHLKVSMNIYITKSFEAMKWREQGSQRCMESIGNKKRKERNGIIIFNFKNIKNTKELKFLFLQ